MKEQRAKRLIGAVAGVAAVAGAPAHAGGGSEAWKQGFNNNRVIEIQKSGGIEPNSGTVTIDYFGHAAFRITSPKGVSMLFDPWRNHPSDGGGQWFERLFPETQVDVVLSTHAHFGHDAVFRPQSATVLDRMSGSFALGDVRITGIADKHVCVAPGKHDWTAGLRARGIDPCPPNNPASFDNVIYLVETGGLRIVVWGDNRADPPAEVWAALGDIDVAIVPIDGSEHILSYAQIDAVIEALDARVVIPCHYLMAGVSLPGSTLETADEWVAHQADVLRTDGPGIALKAAEVKTLMRRVVYFADRHIGG